MGGSGFGGGSSWGSRSSYGSSYSALGGSLSSGRGRAAPWLSPGRGVAVNSFFLSPWGFGGYPMGYSMGSGIMSLLFWGVFAVILLQVGGGGGGGESCHALLWWFPARADQPCAR